MDTRKRKYFGGLAAAAAILGLVVGPFVAKAFLGVNVATSAFALIIFYAGISALLNRRNG